MEWLDILQKVVEFCILPLLIFATSCLIAYLKTKISESNSKIDSEQIDKYTTLLNKVVAICVKATQQTYVDALKESGSFTEEAKKEAFEKTKLAILEQLTEEAKNYLEQVYGNLDTAIDNLIEAQIKENK